MLEEKELVRKKQKLNKWMLIVFYKNGKTLYGKKRFQSENAAHGYFNKTKTSHPEEHKRIKTHIAIPVQQ